MPEEKSIEPVLSPWRHVLLDTLRYTRRSLLLVCPYIKEDIVDAMYQALASRSDARQPLAVRIITRVEPEELYSGASDIAALLKLLAWPAQLPGCTTAMRAIPNVHAKVWIFDEVRAFVGSGNATTPGLDDNIEYGLAISEPQLVRRMLDDWQAYWRRAEVVEQAALTDIQRQIQTIAASPEARQARARERDLERQLRGIRRIGQYITPLAADKLSTIREQSGTPDTYQPGSEVEISSGITCTTIPAPDFLQQPQTSAHSIFLSPSHFWQALRWTIPFVERSDFSPSLKQTVYNADIPERYRNNFLKLVWLPALETPQLQLTWADGRRYSLASVAAQRDTVHSSPWSVILNSEQSGSLAGMVQRLTHERSYLFQNEKQRFQLFLHPSTGKLHLAYQYSRNDPANRAAFTLPCTLAGVPPSALPALPSFAALVTVEQRVLQAALAQLEQQTPAIIELALEPAAPSLKPRLNLSTGPIAAPLVIPLTVEAARISGPAIRLRLDFAALHHALTRTAESVRRWQIGIDSPAETAWFVPQMDLALPSTLPWWHALNHVS